jgi:hypothetical protein
MAHRQRAVGFLLDGKNIGEYRRQTLLQRRH